MDEFINLKKFTIQAKIGQGSFGEVFKVLEEGTKNIFAAKISMSKLNEGDIKYSINLRREVNILSQLSHPSVLKFIGYSPYDFNQNMYPVIITEYSPNGSLEDIIELERKSIPPDSWSDTKKLINIYGIASAMSYLHSHNIIHRDLKPANILEDENLFPKIADFGLSKIYHKNIDSMTAQSTIGFKGTPIYAAPEVWINCEYLKSGDVYSFSVIFYELFSNEIPFKNYDMNMLYSKVIMNGERPEFKHPIHNCYKNLIERCWSHDPENRPTFDEIVEELRTNKEFIIDTIDEDEFINYIDLIDSIDSKFDHNKCLKTIMITEENNNIAIKEDMKEKIETKSIKTSEGKDDESSEINIINRIDVETFNNYPMKKQQETINNIIENKGIKENNKILNNVNDLLKYLLQNDIKSNIQYFYIPTNSPETSIEEILQGTSKINLSHQMIEILQRNKKLESNEFISLLKNINKIFIEIKYPSRTFETIYVSLIKLKTIIEEGLRINILINEINSTDLRFRNDKNIYSIQIDEGINKISGEKIGFRNHGGGSFYGCSSLKRITIPCSVKSIGDYSFCSCSSLKKITLPSNLNSIGEGCFSGCISLREISLPSNLEMIEFNTFFGCSSLKKIIIPYSMKKIGGYAFRGCSSLETISIHLHVDEIQDYAFLECLSLTQIINYSFYTKIGEGTFKGCFSLKEFFIPYYMQEIKQSTFENCSSLVKIFIPSSIEKIGNSAFKGCPSLTEIEIPSSLHEINEYAFFGCSSLNHVSFKTPSSISIIAKSAFEGCSSLTEILIPPSVTKIKESAFKGCNLLAQISIPSSLNEIGEKAFEGCPVNIK